MKPFMRNPRTGLPALAVFVALLLSFAIPPFNSVVAAGSSSSSMSSSSSPPADCNSQFSGGDIKPGDTIRGVLSLAQGCQYIQGVNVHITLNGASLDKQPDQNGAVSVSVKTNTDGTTGVLDDPVDVTLKTGRNDVIVTGTAVDPDGHIINGVTIDAFFTLAAPTTTTSAPIVVTPVTVQTSNGGTTTTSLAHTGMNLFALFLLALMAIALGTYVVASERAVPITSGAGAMASTVSMPLFEPAFGGAETWTLELVALTAVSYILGPPPGRHAKKAGPRGLVPTVRDWMYRDR